jgi:hypothetical protein
MSFDDNPHGVMVVPSRYATDEDLPAERIKREMAEVVVPDIAPFVKHTLAHEHGVSLDERTFKAVCRIVALAVIHQSVMQSQMVDSSASVVH